jgi:hypothetical protein
MSEELPAAEEEDWKRHKIWHMGKKRIIKKGGGGVDQSLTARSMGRLPRKKMTNGILHIQSTYNNTILSLTDENGNVVISSSAGALGFK